MKGVDCGTQSGGDHLVQSHRFHRGATRECLFSRPLGEHSISRACSKRAAPYLRASRRGKPNPSASSRASRAIRKAELPDLQLPIPQRGSRNRSLPLPIPAVAAAEGRETPPPGLRQERGKLGVAPPSPHALTGWLAIPSRWDRDLGGQAAKGRIAGVGVVSLIPFGVCTSTNSGTSVNVI